MQMFVARKNIERYQTLLDNGTLDEPTRERVQMLLREEQATLAQLMQSEGADRAVARQPKQID